MTLGPFAYVFSVLFYKTVFLTVLSFGSSTRLMDQESQRSASLSLCSAPPVLGYKHLPTSTFICVLVP